MGEIEGEVEDSEDITAKIIEAKCKIQVALKVATPEVDVRSPSTDTAKSTASRPRLPKLTIQRFRGEITHWSSFWDSYKSAIHDNASISTIDKFNYLNSLLEDAAARTIQGLTLNKVNYSSAYKIDMGSLNI